MMKNEDVALIRRILDGDEAAFAELVKKYQKPVHMLAWRKIGDFHIAEDITQDTFMKVYQRLHTLKNPNQFSGWLYVITTNLCATWLRKKRIKTQPLEDAETKMPQRDAYSRHVTEDRAKTSIDTQRDVVKKLLANLKESERTVMTLHYLGEMKVEEISRFLGVSASTIKSRLRRARQRLQKEETMIREALEHFQISPNLTDNIINKVARLKPVPSGSKPLIPWAIATSSAVLIMLMLGIGSQYLVRFLQPYSLDAQAEMTVELIDAPIMLNLDTKPNVRREIGNLKALDKSYNRGEKPDDILLAAAQPEGEDDSVPKQQWIQSKAVKGTPVRNLHTTPEGDLYIITNYGFVYRLSKDGNTWQRIHSINKLKTDWGRLHSIAKWDNILYFVPNNELFTSTDDGETWDLLYSWKGEMYEFPIELVLTKQAFYLAFRNGIFRSEDNGKTWKNITDGLRGISEHLIVSFIDIQNTLFVGTDKGCYRSIGDGWKRLEFPDPIHRVVSTAATEGKLYVVARLTSEVSQELKRNWGIFRSTDLGNSWKDITPTNAWHRNSFAPNMTLIAVGDTLLAMAEGMVRSIDSGDTWLSPQEPGTSPSMGMNSPVAVVEEGIIYIGSHDGFYYSTNFGESWHMINIRQKGGTIYNLIAFKKSGKVQSKTALLYARVSRETFKGDEIKKTDDRGNSWKPVPIAMTMTTPGPKLQPIITQIVKYGDALYAKAWDNITLETRIYTVSSDGRTLVPIQEMPVFSSEKLVFYGGKLTDHFTFLNDQFSKGLAFGATQFFKQLAQPQFGQRGDRDLIWPGLSGAFAVDNNTFYMEYNFKLFRWKQGDTEWYDTGLEETVKLSEDIMRRNLKLAVSGNTVYVGKRDGHLVVSFDMGNNWIDLTPALPFSVNTFKEILVAGSTVYVATDAGIITSDDGRNWRTVTDAEEANLIMEHLAVDNTTIYGVTKEKGVYRLEKGTWEQIVSEIPDNVTSLAVDGNTLYVGTEGNGMLHFNLSK